MSSEKKSADQPSSGQHQDDPDMKARVKENLKGKEGSKKQAPDKSMD